MYDLISIGSISIDLFFKSDSFTFLNNRFQLAVGGKYFSPFFHASIGGGGTNVAIGAAKHGLKVAVCGLIGENPFKKIIVDHLETFNISHKFSKIVNDYFNISTILLTEKGERTIIHHSTPHQKLFDRFFTKDLLEAADFVYFGNLPEVSFTQRNEFIHELKKGDITIVLNLGAKDVERSKEQLKNLLEDVDILILNGHEFAELVKAPFKDIHFQENVVSWYIPYLKGKIVVVTLGEKGSFLYSGDTIYHERAVKVDKIIDTTGAGDAYTSAFISKYVKTRNLKDSMQEGALYAAKILSKVGAN